MPPVVDDLGLLAPPAGGLIDDAGLLGPPPDQDINRLVRQVGANIAAPDAQQPSILEGLAQARDALFPGEANFGGTGPVAQAFQEVPGQAATFVQEHPRDAAAMAAQTAAGLGVTAATGGAPLGLLAAGVLGEGLRQSITGEEPDPRTLASSGVLQAIPLPQGALGSVLGGAGISAADLFARRAIQEGQLPSPGEAAGSLALGGLAGGAFHLGQQALMGARAPVEAVAPPPVIDDLGILPNRGVQATWSPEGQRIEPGGPPPPPRGPIVEPVSPRPPEPPPPPPAAAPPEGAPPAGWESVQPGPEQGPPRMPQASTAAPIIDDAGLLSANDRQRLGIDNVDAQAFGRAKIRQELHAEGRDTLSPEVARIIDSNLTRDTLNSGRPPELIARDIAAGLDQTPGPFRELVTQTRRELELERQRRQAGAASSSITDAERAEAQQLSGNETTRPIPPSRVPLLQPLIENMRDEPVRNLLDKLDEIATLHPNQAVARLARRWRGTLSGVAERTGFIIAGRHHLEQPVSDVIRSADAIFTDFSPHTLSLAYEGENATPANWQPGDHVVAHLVRTGLPDEVTGGRRLVRLARFGARYETPEVNRRYGVDPDIPLFNVGSAFGLAPATTGPVMLRAIGENIATALGRDAVAIYSTSRMTGIRGEQRAALSGRGDSFVRPFIIRRRGVRGAVESPAPPPAEATAVQPAPPEAPPAPPAAPAPPAREAAPPPSGNILDRLRGRPEPAEVRRFPIDELRSDPARFQTRATYGSEGVTGQLRDVRNYDDASAGNLAVWRDPADGHWYVVDGHNRLNRFRELGVPDVRAVILDEPTAELAAARGALINMRAGNFDAVDVANFLRNTGATVGDLEAAGVSLSNARNRDGVALANLHPALFQQAASGELPLRRAAILGRELSPGGPEGLSTAEAHAQQLAVVELANRGRHLTDGELEQLIRGVRSAPTRTETQTDLFGERQITSSLALERARVTNAMLQRLRSDARLLGTVSRPSAAARLEAEGSHIEAGRAMAAADQAATIDDRLSALANVQGPVSDLVSDAARRLSQGEPLERVVQDALPRVRDEILSSLGRPPGSPEGGGPGAPAGGQRGLFGNERGAIEPPATLAKLLERKRAGAGADEQPGGVGGRVPGREPGAGGGAGEIRRGPAAVRPDIALPRGSLLSRFGNRGQPSGGEHAPLPDQGVLLYGPDDRPLILTGRMSAHQPDRLAPAFSRGLDEGLADLEQRLGEMHRDRVGYARREVVPVTQTRREARNVRRQIEEYADRVGMTPSAVVAALRRRGEAVNAAGMEVLSQLNGEAALGARAAAARQLIEPSAAHRDAAVRATLLLLDTIPQRAGALAEAGRALHIARYPEGPQGAFVRAVRLLEQRAGGADAVDQLIELLARTDPNDVVAINRFVRDAALSTWRDKLYELWINSLLSGPITQVKNFASNALNQPIRIGERAITGTVDAMRATLTGTERERFVGEALQDLVGTIGGMGDAVRASLRAFQTEIPSEGAAKFLDPGVHGASIKGRAGKLVRLPSRVLLAADEFFKAITFTGELQAQAYRRAAMEGHSGPARTRRMNELLAEPDHDMVAAASDSARYWAFQQRLGEQGQALLNLRNKVPGLGIVLPFVQTPINVAKFGLERTPFALGYVAAKAARGELRGGELSEQVARAMVGTAIAGSIGLAVQQGLVTGGGPRDPAQRRSWLQTHQPYSVKVGDRWISYGNIEPLGSTVGLVADAIGVWHQLDQGDAVNKAAVTMATSLGVNLGNKTFLRGIADMMNAYSDPERYGERWVDSLVGTAVPTGVAQVARAFDPTLRRPASEDQTTGYGEHALEVLRSRIPGQREAIYPVRDVWGEPISNQGFFDGTNRFLEVAEKALSPITTRQEPQDIASKEVARLLAAPEAPDRYVELGREKINLSPAEHDAYVRDSGRLAKTVVTELVKSDFYQRQGPDEQKRIIQRGFEQARAEVRAGLKKNLFDRMRASGQQSR